MTTDLWTRGEVIDRMAELRAAKAPITVSLWNRREADVFARLVQLHTELLGVEDSAARWYRESQAGGASAFWSGGLYVLASGKIRRLNERRRHVIRWFDADRCPPVSVAAESAAS